MKHRSRAPIAAAMLAAVHFVLASGARGLGAESLVANGSFEEWTDGHPDGWKVDVGAMNGAEQPKSEVKPIKGPALMLRGDASTMAWHAVSQEIPARPGASYRLTFESRTRDVQREGRQYDNCYVGIVSVDKAGRLVGRKHDDVSADTKDWTKHRIVFAVPENAESTKVLIFLSKTGILGVRNVGLREATPIDPFAALVDSLRNHYSFAALKGIDWDDLSARYRDDARSARTVEDFAAAIRGMLAELEDLHVWIEMPDGKRVHPYSSGYRANSDHGAVAAKLDSLQRFGPLGFAGRTADGFGVLVSNALPPEDDDLYERLIGATTAMFDAPGFLVDLRTNGGGSEPRARQIAGLFAEERALYARSKRRAGPNADDLLESPPRYFAPTVAEPFTRPVICLVGPGCVSSGEGFALMMKALDHVTLVGRPTRGASGNPQAVTLSNGVKVWFSRWVSMEPDGTPIEGRGILPDVEVEHAGAGDPTFDRAVEILRRKAGVAPAVPGSRG